MAVTLQIEGEAAPRRFAGALIGIGRVDGNDVVVPDPRVSSRHARLVRRGEGYCFEDVGSRNGSMVERAGERTRARPGHAIPIRDGDRLLLGDRDDPVVLRVLSVPQQGAGLPDIGATVVARHSMADEGASLFESAGAPGPLRALFDLLRDIGGLPRPESVMERIVAATLERFPHAASAAVHLADGDDGFRASTVRCRSGEAPPPPSRALVARALAEQSVVGYVDGADAGGGASVAGLAGAAIAPLFAGDTPLGLLHVTSADRHFDADALAWLGIVATHVAASIISAERFATLTRAEESLRAQNAALLGRGAPPIIGESPAVKTLLDQLDRVALSEATVLLQGETGTGKELLARRVHAASNRADGPFVPINCGAFTESLLGSELFGHKKGAFTGADRDHKGLFETAGGGTVFLDEIGEVSMEVQVRLLRVLQEREVQPLGTTRPIPIDVRIVGATNRDLMAEVRAGRFREDLYYRLAVFPVEVPPLRERAGDVERLAEHFRGLACGRYGSWIAGFTAEALSALRGCAWPGNVRQLEHEIERAVILARDTRFIGVTHLSPQVAGGPTAPDPATSAAVPVAAAGEGRPLKDIVDAFEERVIRQTLAEHDGNRTRTAKALGLSRQALQVKLARWRDRDG